MQDFIGKEPLGPCPCGKQIFEAVSEDGKIPAIIHEMPFCKQFEQMELIEYMRWVRTSRGIGDN